MNNGIDIMSDTTGQRIADALEELAKRGSGENENIIEYGVRWVTAASAPALERVTRINGIIAAWDIEFSPNYGKENVTDNPFDYIDIFAPQIYTDAGGNKFSRFKKFYYARQQIGVFSYIWVCAKKAYSFYNAPRAFYKNGAEYWNYYDIGVYEGGEETRGSALHLVSKSGLKLSHSHPRTTFNDMAKAWHNTLNVDTSKEYYSITPMSEITEILQPLMLIVYGTRHSQNVYKGVCDVNTDDYYAVRGENNANRILLPAANQAELAEQFPVGAGVNVDGDWRKVTANGLVTVSGTSYFYVQFDGAAINTTGETSDEDGTCIWRYWNCTGETDVIKATHGTPNNDGTHSFKIFNIENIYGNIWKNVLDCTIYNYTPYMCNDIENWAETSTPASDSKFTAAAYNISKSSGWVKELNYDNGRPDCYLPTAVGGSSETYFADYCWVSNGARTVFFGGDCAYGSHLGLFSWDLVDSMGYYNYGVGARLSHRAL